ncbi:hypothetical protein PSEUDO9AG_40229 [Pseudomonas sp. 9Ag]|nr:hypothetical protein PSEUDO9AG_40229 [Pseudomonas sp. 9Ag]
MLTDSCTVTWRPNRNHSALDCFARFGRFALVVHHTETRTAPLHLLPNEERICPLGAFRASGWAA